MSGRRFDGVKASTYVFREPDGNRDVVALFAGSKKIAFIEFDAFPTLAWVQGEGSYAVIAWCRKPTITLWSSTTLAQAALTELNALRCGGRCTERHEIVHINPHEREIT